MEIWLATINGWDGKSIVGVYSSVPLALKGCVNYLLEEEGRKNLELISKDEKENYVTFNIKGECDIVVIRKMELDKN